MHTAFRSDDIYAWFVLEHLDDHYHDAARSFRFEPIDGGFARRFPLDLPRLDIIYANFARYAETMILQRAGELPVAWEEVLLAFLDIVADEPIDWYLVGSAALAVRGLPVSPGDVDLVIDGPGAHCLGALLHDHLVEPVAPTYGWVADTFARAFLGACLEWLGGINERADQPATSDYGPTAAGRLETVVWRGHELRVPPLDLQLAVSERRGRDRVAAMIREAIVGEQVSDPDRGRA